MTTSMSSNDISNNYTTATTESYCHNINMTSSMSSNDALNSYTTATKEFLGSTNDATGDKGELYSINFRDI